MATYPWSTPKQKFLEESYNKEQDTRLQWYFKNVYGKSQGKSSKQFEVFKKKIEEGCPRPNATLRALKDVQPKSYHKRCIDFNEVPALVHKSGESKVIKDMLPALPRDRTLLYEGFTKEGRGRYQYLQRRYTAIPETKFSFPVLSSWEYGWRLDDVVSKADIHKPAHGRTRVVADTFYQRNGIPGMSAGGPMSAA